MEILHMCIRKENGHYWFYKMDEEKIPLQTDKIVEENFWEYAKIFNKDLKSAIENKQAIDWIAIENLKYKSDGTPT
ncbi:hypothetical protein Avbf_16989 [Armadillidium vulgare]|nr:hypothetical protein Avbf_16989 [Armadillidium vulgare]